MALMAYKAKEKRILEKVVVMYGTEAGDPVNSLANGACDTSSPVVLLLSSWIISNLY